jgi:glycosyltransferase involved in cell wall biosynthesis
MPKVVFYCRDSLDNIHSMEYYRQDIEALKELGHEVVVCNRYRDIPWRFDLMYVWWWTYALYPTLLSILVRKPCFITGTFNFKHPINQASNDYFNRPLYQRLLIQWASKLATLNLFVSKNEFNEVTKYFNLKKTVYCPHSISDEYFIKKNTKENPKEKITITNISWSGKGNLKRKGVFDIIEAAKILNSERKDINFVLAGRLGDGIDQLKAKVEEYGIKSVVTILSNISASEKLDLFKETTIYLQPSYYEGFGLATAEAMASGCCVVTCDVGEVRNVVGDEAMYVKPGSPEQIANAVRILIMNQDQRLRMSEQGQKRIKQLFSFDSKLFILQKILKDLSI